MTWTHERKDAEKIRVGLEDLIARESEVRAGVERYLDKDNDYAAELFNDLGGGGTSSSVTEVDLLAVALLDMSIPPRAVRSLIQNAEVREEVAAELRQVPVDLVLWEAEDTHLDSCLAVWDRVRAVRGMGRTRTSKLLARKRPHLMPIWDDVVDAWFGRPRKVWSPLREVLQDEGRREGLEALRPDVDGAASLSTLRLIDIAVWMAGR
jgi:hypothetical protein